MKQEIQKSLKEALKSLNYDAVDINVDYPKVETFGDYTTNVAMVLAQVAKKNPMIVAEEIKNALECHPEFISGSQEEMLKRVQHDKDKIQDDNDIFEKIEVVAPGYINFYLSKECLQEKVSEINKLKNKFGDSEIGKGTKVNNEFISANPTGPLHLGNGRGGFFGDVISNILTKCGYRVRKEYYVNDAGEQLLKLGHSVKKDSEAAYSGEYIDELNKEFLDAKDIKEVGEKSAKIILDEIIKKTVEEKMKISFDSWISEKNDLIEKGYVERAIGKLEKNNLVYEKEGATWLKTTKFGDDKDRVLIKKDGQKTYFASDCGYILYKIENKFEKIIETWGADHHGYISRFRAAAGALGFEGELKFVIVQLVRLMKDGKEAKMSKRSGNVVYIDELIEEVGLGAVRFFFLMYDANTHMTFDLGLAKERSEKNPVYYIQYAHARICSILEKAKELELEKSEDVSLLVHEKELSLIRELNKFPEVIEEISQSYAVHKLPYYVISLADKFHSFYNDCKVIDEENPELSSARLNLINAVRIVLAEALRLLGVNSPNKM